MCCGCSTRIVQIGGGVPFTFSVTAGNSPYNGGLGVITGPIAINNNDIIHFYSVNTINFQVIPGSANTFAEVRLDPNINNIITASPLGLLVDGSALPSGVNIYNSDGTITDPNRIVTIGASTLNFNADNAGFLSNTAITTNQFRIDYSDPAGYAGSFSDNSTYNEMANGNAALDEVARIFTQDSAGNDPSAGIQAASGPFGVTGIDVNSGSNLGNYINLYNNLGTYFELRLDGDPGVAGYTIISQGPGASPIWGPGGGGGLTAADNGLSLSGSTVQLGTVLAGTGAPLTANRFLEIGAFTFDFTGNAGASKVLGLDDTQNAAWRSDYYDLSSSRIQHAKADRPTFFTNLGILQQQDPVVRRAVTTVSIDYTVDPTTDEHIHVDTTGGPVTITLASLAASGGSNARRTDATAASWYQFLTISRRGGNALTIQAPGGHTIDNAASITVNNNRGVSIQGVSTTEWVTINNA
jgi:hypothetical protein